MPLWTLTSPRLRPQGQIWALRLETMLLAGTERQAACLPGGEEVVISYASSIFSCEATGSELQGEGHPPSGRSGPFGAEKVPVRASKRCGFVVFRGSRAWRRSDAWPKSLRIHSNGGQEKLEQRLQCRSKLMELLDRLSDNLTHVFR